MKPHTMLTILLLIGPSIAFLVCIPVPKTYEDLEFKGLLFIFTGWLGSIIFWIIITLTVIFGKEKDEGFDRTSEASE